MFHCAWDIYREIAKNHRSFWSCVWEKLERRNQITIVTQPFSKSSDFKMFSVLAKKKIWLFQIPLVFGAWRIISANCRPIRKTCVFKFLSCNMDGGGFIWQWPGCHCMCQPFSKYTRWRTSTVQTDQSVPYQNLSTWNELLSKSALNYSYHDIYKPRDSMHNILLKAGSSGVNIGRA